MEQGTFEGIRNFSHGNFEDQSKQVNAALSAQKDLDQFFQLMDELRSEHLDIHRSNRRLDAFLFYRSSRL